MDKTEEIEIRLLLEALFQKYHFDFRGYAMASLKRRLKRARDDLGFATTSAMQDRLLRDAAMAPEAPRIPDGAGQRDVSRSRLFPARFGRGSFRISAPTLR